MTPEKIAAHRKSARWRRVDGQHVRVSPDELDALLDRIEELEGEVASETLWADDHKNERDDAIEEKDAWYGQSKLQCFARESAETESKLATELADTLAAENRALKAKLEEAREWAEEYSEMDPNDRSWLDRRDLARQILAILDGKGETDARTM